MSEVIDNTMVAPGSAAVAPETAPAPVRAATVVAPPVAAVNPLPALLVLAVALLLWVAYQAYALLAERENLMAGSAQMAPQVEAATKVRASIDSIAAGVKRLSEGGNTNARIIVDELARRGVTINSSTPQPPAPGK